MHKTPASCGVLFAAILASGPCLAADKLPFVNPMFGHNMVLQRGKTNVIWGWAAPGEKVKVEVGGSAGTGTASESGRWEARILPPTAPGPHRLRIAGTQTVEFTNVLAGDVWLCGGQSNMELPLSRTRNGEEAIRSANQPNIRLFMVKSQPSYRPATIIQGSWKVCSPTTVSEEGGFSAVGYHFAKRIREDVNVPIGLIKDCIGGTPAEAWTSSEGLRDLKEFDPALREIQRLAEKGGPQYGNYIMHWYDEFDIGQRGQNWADPALDDSGWTNVSIPGGFRELGVPEAPSLCHFRKEIILPNPLPAGKAVIHLGVIEKMDTTQINGRWVGASAWVENPRVYSIPDGVLNPGRNVLAVRVLKLQPNGGFQSKPEQLKLVLGDKTEIQLAGEWKGKVSVDARPPHPLPLGFENWPVMPSVLYNGMIHPMTPLAISGAIWYQGEANASRALQYRTLLPAMIRDWRKAYGQGDFPFYIVSLASFMAHKDTPGDDWWAELREAQALTASTVKNSGLAVTIDIGDAQDIHPKDKKEVGERLALQALSGHYGKRVVPSGPVFAAMKELPGALRLTFKNVEGGLVAKGGKPGEFAIAGEDRKWVWADAKVEGDSVIVSSPKVPTPKAARYAWQANPAATLYNGAGLPAVPFRTDDWPLTSQ